MAGRGASEPVLGPASVIGKVSLILDAFGFDDHQLGLSELARRTGLAKATVHRLALDLVAAGLLERAGPSFCLGGRLFEIGQRVSRPSVLRDAARPFMEDLLVATHHTIHLGVLEDGEVLYVEKLAGKRPVDAPSRVAGRMPLHCTATGKAILAFLPLEARQRVLTRRLERITPFTITDARVLDDQLRQIRTDGVSLEIEETRVGYVSVAAPFFGPGPVVLGALSATAPKARIDPSAIGPAVRTATRGLTRVLRADPSGVLRDETALRDAAG